MSLLLRCIGRVSALVLCLLHTLSSQAQSTVDDEAGRGALQLVTDKPHLYAAAQLDTDRYTSRLTLTAGTADIGQLAAVYAVANHAGDWYLKTPERWQRWDQQTASLTPFTTISLNHENTLELFNGEPLLAGDYVVYAAYQVANNPLLVSPSPMTFTIESAGVDTLHRFDSAVAMEAYLKQGMQNTASDQTYYYRLETLAAAATDSSTTPTVSTTNVQVAGVDEADTIKSDGSYLYTLRNCGSSNCVVTFSLNPALATAEEVGVYQPVLNKESDKESDKGAEIFTAAKGLYLIEDDTGGDTLVTVSGQNHYIPWINIWGWSSNATRLEFLDAHDPAQLRLQDSLTLDGTMVASRRVGNTLYLVTRYSPNLPDFVPYAFDDTTRQANVDLLAQKSLSDLLPKARFQDQSSLDLVQAESCYLATSAVDESRNPSMITITAIPLDDIKAFHSSCYLGDSETLYMTTQSLFLATTQNEYSLLAADAIFYNPDHRTAIHKFALTDGGVDYRGSGEVRGHLGWSEDKRSFRMGANGAGDEYLNIVTSIGDTWNGDASTRLTVLKQSGKELRPIQVLDGIGKPGEQLYAARFFGERAYLVTYRVIDPLYVLDLSDQEHVRITGELEIQGYSDYLHPISSTLLLGIGKDAIPDDGSTDFGFQRGAWYQGVKLSLFDVSDPARPTEINSLVYGKRGSSSEALYDHHAISFLPATAAHPARFALPIQIHATAPDYADFDPAQPNAYYSFTNRGLYAFEASADGVSQAGYIEADSTDGTERYSVWGGFGDRSVLVDDTVYYIHESEVKGAAWGSSSK